MNTEEIESLDATGTTNRAGTTDPTEPLDRAGTADPTATALARLPEPAGILFDLDGTLVDTFALRVEAWRRVLEEGGIPVERSRLEGYIGSDGRWLARQMAHAAGRTLDEREARHFDARHGEVFDEINRAPRPLPGASELLTALERSRLVFAVATSSQPGQIAVSLAALDLPAPPPIVNGGHVAHAKPEPDLLLAAARELRLPPKRCWYVGDSTWDMLASARAGMTGIGVTTGAADAAALVEAGGAVAVRDLRAVLATLVQRGLVERRV